MESKLPKKLSDCLELAMKDLEKVEAQPEVYRVNMSEWHEPDPISGVCYVCLAGSVMAKTFELHPDQRGWSVLNELSSIEDQHRLLALDHLRQGELRSAINFVGGGGVYYFDSDQEVVPYYKSPEGFKKDMYAILEDLRSAGL